MTSSWEFSPSPSGRGWHCCILYSPREPYALAWGPSSSHTKAFGSSGRDWKPGKKLPIPCKFFTYRFIRYSSTCYGKVRIDPLVANIRNPDFFASPVVNAAWFVVVLPCYLNMDRKEISKIVFRPNFFEIGLFGLHHLTISPIGQNGRHFADDIFRCIFVNEKLCILIQISLKFVPMGPADNDPALVKRMAWRRIGDKPLFEPMLFSSLTDICVTQP